MRLLIIHDIERGTPMGTVRWAYANRSHALQKYAPDGWKVDRVSIYQLQSMFREHGHEPFMGYDVVFNIDYQSAMVARTCLPDTVPMISSFNKDTTANTNFWAPCYAASDFVICNNLDRFTWAVSQGLTGVGYISNGVDVDFWDSDRPMHNREIDASWCGSTAPKKGKGYQKVIVPLEDMLTCNTSFRPILNAESRKIYTVEQQREWYSRSKIYLCASNTEGGGPSSLMEAMACGCAPVTTNIGSVPEFGVDEFNCLIQTQDPVAFKQDIEYLLDNPSFLEDVGNDARRTIRKDYAYGSENGPDKWFYALFEKVARREEVKPFDYKSVAWDKL